jgi:hypothetical protein
VTYRAVKTLLALASIVLIPAPASAQFTTFIVPPPKAKVDSAKAVIAAAQSAHADSAARMTISDMKAWVDSAAGATSAAPAIQAADTTAAPVPAEVTKAPRSTPTTTRFSDGALAPSTASPLPALAVAGFALIIVGGALLRLRPKRIRTKR